MEVRARGNAIYIIHNGSVTIQKSVQQVLDEVRVSVCKRNKNSAHKRNILSSQWIVQQITI
jgi:hypothetical protein